MMTSCDDSATQRLEDAARWHLWLTEVHSPEERADFEEWLSADPRNEAALTELRASLDIVDSLSGTPELVRLRGEALRAAGLSHDLRRARAFLTSRLVGRLAAMAAAIACLAIAAIWWTVSVPQVQTAVAERRTVSLPDGSRLSLDADTRVTTDYSRERRQLTLWKGRAKFEVAKDALRPFTVAVGGRMVVALGTSFSVELIDGEVHVALYDGRVDVMRAGSSGQWVSITSPSRPGEPVLTPGHELVLSANAPPPAASSVPRDVMKVSAVSAERSLSWESGDLSFADEPLSVAVARVNRYTSRPLRVGDAKAAGVRISGVFHEGDVEAFVSGVTGVFPITARRDGQDIELVSAQAAR
ncbi:MAG TPA: FecR domain-containing protein [Steroidobacteraceae bacterium]|nr:FecR domain-containing protein [Steroidobacteraceae bacterium]